MAIYVASDRALAVIDRREDLNDAMSSSSWPREAQRLHTAKLSHDQEAVRSHFVMPHVLYAGSIEGCGCGFNYGREYPDLEDDEEYRTAARESVAELVRYVRSSGVREIYSCWFGDEELPTAHERTISPGTLASPDFFFREQELLRLEL